MYFCSSFLNYFSFLRSCGETRKVVLLLLLHLRPEGEEGRGVYGCGIQEEEGEKDKEGRTVLTWMEGGVTIAISLQAASKASSCQMFDLVKITLPQFNYLALRGIQKNLPVVRKLLHSLRLAMSKEPSLIHPSLLHDSCLLSDPLFRSPGARGKGERGRGERGVFARIINKPFLSLQQPGSRVG